MTGTINKIVTSIFISVVPTLLIWIPFFFRMDDVWGIPISKDGMAAVVSNYDGPLYIVAAKTMYDKEQIKTYEFGLPTEYYAAHFPVFPILIKMFAAVLGFPYAMLLVTLMTSVLAVYFFHELISEYADHENSWWLTFLFAIFPARFLIVRSIGSPEALFIASVIASLFYFRKGKMFLASIWGAISVMTKSPGILLFVGYFLTIITPEIKRSLSGVFNIARWRRPIKKYLPLIFMPMSLLGVFIFYKFRMNDFLAYFHSGDNIHLFFPPFQIFNYSQPWVGTFWLEEIIFIYLLAMVGIAKLVEQKEAVLAWFAGVFFALILFVSHRDVLRYALPIVPCLFVAYRDFLVKREFKIIVIILLIPIYLFSLAYISQNRMPIADWGPLL